MGRGLSIHSKGERKFRDGQKGLARPSLWKDADIVISGPFKRPKRSAIKYALLFSFFLTLAFLQSGCTENKASKTDKPSGPPKLGVIVGDIAHDFSLKRLNGKIAALSDYRGKIVLVNFWATWCGPCKAEMPSMEALYQHYQRQDFEILAISIDLDPNAPVKEFIQDFGFTFPVLLDTTFEVNDQYQVRVVPTSVVVDRKGIITHRLLGAKDWNDPNSKLFIDKLIAADLLKNPS